jgi:hypothetical protein
MVKINRLLTWPTVLLFLALCAMTSTALAAADPPAPDTDASAWIKALYDAVTSKAWTPAVGLALIGLVYGARRWALGWVSWFKTPFGGLVLAFSMSLAGTMGVAFAAGAKPTLSIAATSLTTAAAAAGVWEWLKAHIPGVQQAAGKAVDPGAA